MIIKIVFPSHSMYFGTSYKPWQEQVEEYMKIHSELLKRPIQIFVSASDWISFGGLKWCSGDNFQNELTKEGKGRKVDAIKFCEANTSVNKEVNLAFEKGQRLCRISRLSDEEYRRYQKGELKIEVP